VGDILKSDHTKSVTAQITDALLIVSSYIVPPHSLTVAASKSVLVARMNALCDLNRDKCPNLIVAENGFDVQKCCGKFYCYCVALFVVVDSRYPSATEFDIGANAIKIRTVQISKCMVLCVVDCTVTTAVNPT
jgi:hypothetical protein